MRVCVAEGGPARRLHGRAVNWLADWLPSKPTSWLAGCFGWSVGLLIGQLFVRLLEYPSSRAMRDPMTMPSFSNAVENILAAPNLPANKHKDMLKKKNYGKVPKYLQTIKKEIEDEYQLVREMQIEDEAEMDRQKFLMNDDEKNELIMALKKKWEVTHKEYQTLTHKNKLDTLGLKEKYERCERELNQLEKDIQ